MNSIQIPLAISSLFAMGNSDRWTGANLHERVQRSAFRQLVTVRRVCKLSGHLDRGSLGALVQHPQKSGRSLAYRFYRVLSIAAFHAVNSAWSSQRDSQRNSVFGA